MRPPIHPRAFALVLVLIVVVLTATMAVLFLGSTARERRGVDAYARGSQVRHLGQLAVSQVMAEINAATKEGTASAPVSWASQPGMIRTFAGAAPKSVYKLYSWDNLVTTGTVDLTSSAETPPADWSTKSASFVNLNEPLDQVYPIVDPTAETKVEGFSIDKSAPAVTGSPHQAPMPVKWLYVLEDGQMVVPSAAAGKTATVPGASSQNPIVGRVAFWTDDETAKVNINTASEGAFWDTPKAATYDEMQFAGNPPMAGEYNRIPGHPAMTSLSAVFPELAPGERWQGSLSSYREKLAAMLAISPRVPYSNDSSRGGTYPIETANFNYGPASGVSLTVPNAPIPPKSERLFVSPDEMLFTYPLREAQPSLTKEMVQSRSFFMTASSRAPETTLFETPRVSLWPVTWPYASAHSALPNRQTAAVSSPNPNSARLADNSWMRAEERLLAFVSTLNQSRADGGDRFFFQRQNPESPTHDYLRITRNQQLLTYLQSLTDKTAPGYGGSLASNLTAGVRDRVLGNTFNSVRSLVNQYTLQEDGKMMYSFTPVAFRNFTFSNGSKNDYSELGAFSAVPMKLNLGTGEFSAVSDFPVLREAALVFYATERVAPNAPASASDFPNPYKWENLINLDASNGYPLGAQTTQMRAVMILDFASLRGATRNNQPVFWIKLSGGDSLRAAGQNLGIGSAALKMDYREAGKARNMPSYLFPLFNSNAVGRLFEPKTFNSGSSTPGNYGLVSVPINVNPSDLDFNFVGGIVNVEVYGVKDGNPDLDPTSDAALKMGSYRIDFSKWNGFFGVPLSPTWNYFEFTVGVAPTAPNPNYHSHDPSKPTKWAAIEIAPGYTSAESKYDPAVAPGSASSVWPYSQLYKATGADGRLVVSNNVFTYTVTYAQRDAGGSLMLDYAKRLKFIFNTDATAGSAAYDTGRSLNDSTAGNAFKYGFPAITPYDTVLSMVVDPTGPGNGDPRLGQSFQYNRADVAVGPGALLREVLPLADYNRRNRQYHTLGSSNNLTSGTGYVRANASVLGIGIAPQGMARIGYGSLQGKLGNFSSGSADGAIVGVDTALPQSLVPVSASVGDWTSQAGNATDGGALPRPDQDMQVLSSNNVPSDLGYQTPYFRYSSSTANGLETGTAKGYFSPNRQIPSPVSLLGALPRSLTKGWETLAFSPNPAAGASHPGLSDPPDYLLLDLFWMPVVEPYPISEEFSTAGKVNLNYEIAPFRYIKRKTALHALMKPVWLTALNQSLAANYKSHEFVKGEANSQTRFPLDVEQTLNRIDQDVFDKGEIFRSGAEVCHIWLVPKGRTAANVESFWNDKLLTSDTAREEPYDNLYSRVTTKSNTFTVHWRAQVLRQSSANNPANWDDGTGIIGADLRGSTLIERYLNPNATDIPDYATDTNARTLSHFYKWRVVSETLFQP